MSNGIRWQYSVSDLDGMSALDIEEHLDKLGEMGWELVSVVTTNGADECNRIAIMKRPRKDADE